MLLAKVRMVFVMIIVVMVVTCTIIIIKSDKNCFSAREIGYPARDPFFFAPRSIPSLI